MTKQEKIDCMISRGYEPYNDKYLIKNNVSDFIIDSFPNADAVLLNTESLKFVPIDRFGRWLCNPFPVKW